MTKYCSDLSVSSVERLSSKHVLLKLTQASPFPEMFPGQFVEIRVDHSPTTFLRRPISVNLVDIDKNEMWLLVAAIGDGTRELAQLRVGDTVNCVFPLGKGFTTAETLKGKRVLLVGGGVGVAPMLFQGQKIKDAGGTPYFLLGARKAEDLLELDYFKRTGEVYITTEDASAGEKGYVTDHSILKTLDFDFIQTCGPKPMMVAVARYARERGIACEASLENLMACGIGACLCCVEKTDEGNLCVCTEGPVFNIKKLLW